MALLVTQNCDARSNNRPGARGYDRFMWSQLESSGLVPVEVNVQDTMTDLATGMMQMWANAQEWYQEIQANSAQKPTTPKPTIPEYLYEEEIPIVTNKVTLNTNNKLKKKKLGQQKNVKKKNPIMSTLPEKAQEEVTGSHHKPHKEKPVKTGDKDHVKPGKRKRKKPKKDKNITKVIDYQNYYYFFMGLLGLWPQF